MGFVNVQASGQDEGEEGGQTSIFGVILVLVAQGFAGGQFVTEEKILAKYSLDPLYIVGLEGFWGCCTFAVLLPIF